MEKELKQKVRLVTGQVTPQAYQQILQWLESRFELSIGLTFFLNQTQIENGQWVLLCLYDAEASDQILGVAVGMNKGTCFWLPDESPKAALLCRHIFKLQPFRIMTTLTGSNLLHQNIALPIHIRRESKQWTMICSRRFPKAEGRFALVSDIERLKEYQDLYNQERAVTDTADWETLIQQNKIIVYTHDELIVSVVRLGIETQHLVSIGGTYTFPSYRRRGFAAKVIEYAVDQIVSSGHKAHLIVDQDNYPAIELYQQLGFENVGTAYVGYLDYDCN